MRKAVALILILVLTSFLSISCSQERSPAQESRQEARFVNITADEAHQLIEKNKDVVVIDVRTPPEFSGPLGHIRGAQLKPLQEIENWMAELEKYQGKKIVLVCRSGNRSRAAAEILAQKGISNLYNVEGGMKAWNAKGFEVEK